MSGPRHGATGSRGPSAPRARHLSLFDPTILRPAIVVGDSGPYSMARAPGVSEAAGLRRASNGDPANFPGVWVQSGSSAIRSPVIP